MIIMLLMMLMMKKMVTRQGGILCTQCGLGQPPRVGESPRPRHMMMTTMIMTMMKMNMMMMMTMKMMLSHLIFDVKVSSGLAENLNDPREAVPRCNVQTRLLVLGIHHDADDHCEDGDGDDHHDRVDNI